MPYMPYMPYMHYALAEPKKCETIGTNRAHHARLASSIAGQPIFATLNHDDSLRFRHHFRR